MSNLVPDPIDRSDSQIVQNVREASSAENQDGSDLYFQDLITQQQSSLTATTNLDEYKGRLEIIQIALNVEGQIIDIKEKRTEIERKNKNLEIQIAQDRIKIDIAKIDLIDRQTKSTDLKLRTNLRLLSIPIFTVTGVYFWYTSDSFLGSALLYLGLRLAFSSEDPIKDLNVIKNIFPK